MDPAPATVAALAAYVSAAAGDAYVAQCAAEAAEMVARAIGSTQVPDATVARAELEAGAELYYRRQARNGIVGLDSPDFAPMRIARDPMRAALPFLAPYLGPVLA